MKTALKPYVHENCVTPILKVHADTEVAVHRQEQHAPHRCTIIANDANDQAGNLTDWEQEYDQIGAGRFCGRIDELNFGGLQLFNEHTGRSLRQRCKAWPDSFWFGFPSKRNETRINGQSVESSDVLCRPGSTEFELVTPESFDMLSIVVSKAKLQSHKASEDIDLKLLDAKNYPRLRLSLRTLQNFRYLLRRILQPTINKIDSDLHHDLLIMGLLELLAEEIPNKKVAPSYQHRKAVVERIKDYMATESIAPVTMTTLCEVGCASRRTLQYSFETILGISPMTFLRISRLNRAKRMLCQPSTSSVSEAASFNGFYHLSQFSSDYRQLFGELPSETFAKSHPANNSQLHSNALEPCVRTVPAFQHCLQRRGT